MKLSARKMVSCGIVIACIAWITFLSGNHSGGSEAEVDRIIARMSMDEKISQMIIPAIRSFDGENVTELDKAPELKKALRKHQYGGVILFGQNITGTEQITRLLYDLKENNTAAEGVSTHIPYLTPVDEEGGIVIRLTTGTRMTGNMAIGATDNAEENAEKTGEIIGEELAAAGFNTDYAPVIDVNNNPANPVIGTRSFSDDPEAAASLGKAYAKGLNKSNVIATFKHFPGHGDTGVDSHIGTPSVEKTYDEIRENELIPFMSAIENGADMIMTAHITYPLIDDEVIFGDGKTKGYYPATMSKKMITDILRNDMGFNGVVVTDALEMDAIRTAGLVKGEEDSVEYRVNIAEKVINAGVDILLIPTDMMDREAVDFYDAYISRIEDKVATGEIDKKRIDESVKRILLLKSKYGILDTGKEKPEDEDIEAKVSNSLQVIGSESHHAAETEIAGEAVTILKNDEELIPLSNDVKKIELLGRLEGDAATINYAVEEMRRKDLISNTAEVSFDHYLSEDKELLYTDEMKERITSADIVIGFSYAAGTNILDKENPAYAAIHRAIEDAHKANGKFILLSENLPYDAAVFQDADAIVLGFMGAGLDTDPTEKEGNGAGSKAVNANIIAAMEIIFGANSPKGKLPVNIPAVRENDDGLLEYSTEILYEKGSGQFIDHLPVKGIGETTYDPASFEITDVYEAPEQTVSTDISDCDTFTQIVDKLDEGKGYANVTIGDADVLMVSSGTYEWEKGEYAAIDSEIFIYKDGSPEYLATVTAGGTAYPLAVRDGNLYVGGNHFMSKYLIDDGFFIETEEAYVKYDTDGNDTYYYRTCNSQFEDYDEETAESRFNELFDEQGIAEVISFQPVGGMAADGSLPAYEYPGPELFYSVLYKYMTDELSKGYSDYQVCIPCPVIIKVDESDKSDIRVYGNFWIFNYNLNGTTLENTSGGSYPGCIHLKATDSGYEVSSMDIVEDGAGFTDSAKKIFGDNYDLFMKDGEDETLRERIRSQIIANYVAANNLDINEYKDYGWDPVSLPDENIDSFYSELD